MPKKKQKPRIIVFTIKDFSVKMTFSERFRLFLFMALFVILGRRIRWTVTDAKLVFK